MPLTVWQRKERLPFGAQKQVAAEEKVHPSVVSRIVNGKAIDYGAKKVRRIQVRLARKMGLTVDEAFGEERTAATALQEVA